MTDTLDQATTEAPAPAPATTKPRRSRGRRLLLGLSTVSIVLGLMAVTAPAVAPEGVDRVTGEFKVTVTKQVREIIAPDELPVIRLAAEGGMRELDRCDGTLHPDDELPHG